MRFEPKIFGGRIFWRVNTNDKNKDDTLEECFAPPYPCAHKIILRRSVPAGEAPYLKYQSGQIPLLWHTLPIVANFLKHMETMPQKESPEVKDIRDAIAGFGKELPDEPAVQNAVQNMKTNYNKALDAAKNNRGQIMSDRLEQVYGGQHLLASKGHDVLVEMEEIDNKIKGLLKG